MRWVSRPTRASRATTSSRSVSSCEATTQSWSAARNEGPRVEVGEGGDDGVAAGRGPGEEGAQSR
ncbi:hypothetical protein GA0115246_1058312 [Streptomyces sp. SolWspMP-sol7th]|nr:hypothetical protein GA0115246_1058312 [Streptomyces sp. SolWspMP-sol7th]